MERVRVIDSEMEWKGNQRLEQIVLPGNQFWLDTDYHRASCLGLDHCKLGCHLGRSVGGR